VNKPPTDQKWAHTWLTDLVSKIGMQICQGPITTYLDMPGNRGLTGLVIIETSHIALHCWDESDPGLMQLDVYTCGDLQTEVIFEEIKQFGPVKVEYKFLDREHELTEIEL
jgi:S-adenosylmethionine/arginine decarboxylase-like enzyme